MACCVPGCIYLHQKWSIQFPRDAVLRARWKASIKAGTGKYLSNASVQLGASVCSLHFSNQTVDDSYREPSLFTKTNIQTEVACCRLCLRFVSTDKMLDMNGCLEQGSSLQWLASKYFWLFQLDNERKGYFCTKCIDQVEMTDVFGQKICHAATVYQKLLQKMTTEKMAIMDTSYDHVPRKDNSEANASVLRKSVLIGYREESTSKIPQPIIVKEEPNNVETESVMVEGPIGTYTSCEDIIVKEETRFTELHLPEAELSKRIEAAPAVDDKKAKDPVQTKCKKQRQAKKPSNPNDKPLATRTGGKGRKTPTCLLCQASFLHSKEIVTHFAQDHPERVLRIIDCKDCDEVFFAPNSYHAHRHYHTNTYACEQCGKKHLSRRALVRHLHIAHEAPFSDDHYLTCPICDKKVRDYNYTSHVRHHTKLGQTADNFEEKRRVVAKQYKKLLKKRMKEGVNIGSKKELTSSESDFDMNDSEKKVQNEGRMEVEGVVEILQNESDRAELRQSDISQNVTIKEEPVEAESESIILEGVAEVGVTDVLEDLVVKEEPRLTESYRTSDGHKKKASNISAPYKCYVCNIILETKVALNDHFLNDHKTKESNTCKECGLVFNKISSYNVHLSKYDPDKRYKCSYCKHRFNFKEKQMKHETSRHGIDHSDKKRKPLPCDACGKIYYSQVQLKLHLRVKHKQGERIKETAFASRGGTGRSVPTCLLCKMTFKKSKEVVTHFEQVHPEKTLKTYNCEDCDEVFFLQHCIANHRNTHTDRYACDRCGKRHSAKADLVRHLHVVHKVPYDEERYRECPTCHQKIRDYNYSAHQRIHRDDGPVSCEHCGKTFKSTFLLGKHNSRCLNEKPLASRTGGKHRNMPKCNVCDATFEQMKEVVTHFEQVHPEKEFKTYPCKICGEVLFTYCMLFKHKYEHSTTYACDLCEKITQSKHQLTRHKKSVHGIKPNDEFFVSCEVCDHRFTRHDFYRHLKSEKHKINVAKSQVLEQQKQNYV